MIQNILSFIKKYQSIAVTFGISFVQVVAFSIVGTIISFLFFEAVHKICSKKAPKKREKKEESSYNKHARELGISYRFGESFFVYNIGVRGFAAVVALASSYAFSKDIVLSAVSFVLSLVVVSVATHILSVKDEEECELDVYRMLCNLKVQMKSGAYVDSCVERTKNNCLSPRFEAALGQFISDMNNKSFTMAESAEYFSGAFLSPAFKDMGSILVTFMTYGESDQVYSDIDEACANIVDLNSVRLAKQVTGRGEFSVTWIYVAMVAALVPTLLVRFGDIPKISNFICRIIEGFSRIFS